MNPRLPPNGVLFFVVSPLKLTPTYGAMKPSARAIDGVATRAPRTITPAASRLISVSSKTEPAGNTSTRVPSVHAGRARHAGRDCDPRGCGQVRTEKILRAFGCRAQQFPRTPYMPLLGPDIADGETQGVPAVKLRMRQECLARCVHAVQNRRVDALQRVFVIDARRVIAEADNAERHRRQSVPIRSVVDPGGKCASEIDVSLEPSADAVGAEIAEHHPQLQRAKAPTELDAGVHQVLHRGIG